LVSAIGTDDSVLICIKDRAFNAAFSSANRSSSLNLIYIPASVITLGVTAFAFQQWTSAYTVGL
jgi:hypothetical protein